MSGSCAASASRTAFSLAVSTSLTQSPGAFARMLLAPPPNPSSTISPPMRAARFRHLEEVREIEVGHPAAARSAWSSPDVPAATSLRRAFGSAIAERTVLAVDDLHAGFGADQEAAEVVPRRVHAAGVEVAVERAVRDVAERERARAERPELLPREHPPGEVGDPDHRVLDPGRGRRHERPAVTRRALAAQRAERRTGRVVDDERGERTLAVERAERRRPVRDVAGRVARPVDRVDDDGDAARSRCP